MSSSTSSQSLESIFSDPESYSSESPSPDPVPPPLIPLPPPQCDDWHHCDPTGINCGGTFHVCPGFDPVGGNVTYGPVPIFHPAPPAGMGFAARVCDQCRQHDNGIPHPKNVQVRTWADANAYSGNLIQLCHSCIQDEVELYWQRLSLNTPVPALPAGASPSLFDAQQWPTTANTEQNLCICHSRAIATYDRYCHQCRDQGFQRWFTAAYHANEQFLRTKTKPVITGQKLCDLHAPHNTHPAHRITQRTIQARMNASIGRMCPCGERPKAPEATTKP
ncbi:uncharacterized protein EKO05_0006047 [Ascochyta rabiei]|uniref:uncharacterized protein n=1 Tax=Didymella rabiei TaxID=5454 RepID=UPI002203D57A|nr:uncharacterized protein EKO05_0006047 [Ascochyta rabiei]UPX15604.1 hypothetical protein EKO05_0006047 [Ascochyta rabiei]